MALPEGVNFSRNQKRGIWVLGLLMLIGMLIRFAWTTHQASSPVGTLPSLQLAVESPLNPDLDPIDINLADSLDWVGLRGIGPVL
ncbi:MAG: hypothetical protein AAF804_22445, partial [Bacteroidota bacterium]